MFGETNTSYNSLYCTFGCVVLCARLCFVLLHDGIRNTSLSHGVIQKEAEQNRMENSFLYLIKDIVLSTLTSIDTYSALD